MSKKSIRLLSIITGVVFIGILLTLLYSVIFDHKSSIQGRVFQDLMDETADISQISIKTKDSSLTFIKGEKNWTLQEKYSYPVPVETLQALLLGMADLRYLEEKTSKPERYKDIGVENVTDPDAHSKLIQLLRPDESVIAEILVGRQTPAKGLAADTASFIRKPSEPTSWMADGLKPVSTDMNDWIGRQILTIPASDIQQVQLIPNAVATPELAPKPKTSKGKKPKAPEPPKPLVLKRINKEDRDFQIGDLPAKTKIKSQTEINAIANSLFNLEFLDVIPASSLDDKAWTQTVIFQDFNGQTISLNLVDAGKAKVDLPQESLHDDEDHDHDHDKEDLKKPNKPEPAPMTKGYWVKVTTTGENFLPLQEKTKDWIFLIPQETGNKLMTKMDALVD